MAPIMLSTCRAPRCEDTIRDDIRAITGGGVDIVIEIVGGEVFDGSVRALNFGGSLVVVGFTGGTIPTFKVNYALLKNIAVTGVNWAEYRDRDPEWVQRFRASCSTWSRTVRYTYPFRRSIRWTKWSMLAELSSTVKSREKVVISMG